MYLGWPGPWSCFLNVDYPARLHLVSLNRVLLVSEFRHMIRYLEKEAITLLCNSSSHLFL